MLQPAFGRTGGADVRVVIGKPHLIINRTGTSSVGNESVQLQVGLWFNIIVRAIGALVIDRFAPIVVFDIKGFQFGLITAQ